MRITCDCGTRVEVQDTSDSAHTCPGCGRKLTTHELDAAIQSLAPTPSAEDKPNESTWNQQPVQTSRRALASLILGILSMLVPIILFSIPALFMALLGLSDISKSKGRLRGRGLAIAGIVTAVLGAVLFIPLVLVLLIPVVTKTRETAERLNSRSHLQQIVAAMYRFQAEHGALPPAAVRDQTGKPLSSWRVLLLPYLDEAALYREFNFNEPWDGPHNRPLLDRMPKVYALADDAAPASTTHYQVFIGRDSAFEFGLPIRIPESFSDGIANTILVVEATEAAPWTKPQDLVVTPSGPLPKIGGLRSGGFNALFADGTVHDIPADTDETSIRAMITRNGGENVTPPAD